MINAGVLFAIPLGEAGFVTGHAILDIQGKRLARKLLKGSRLREHGAVLLDVYGPATPHPNPDANAILIRGIWTDAGRLRGRDRWPSIGIREIVPESVEFPEYVINVSGQATFERGEIVVDVPALTPRLDELRTPVPYIALGQLAKICTNLVGRRDLLGTEAILFDLNSKLDLRYSAHRGDVYRAMGVEPTQSYWEWATAEGLNPGRLWT